MSNSMIPEHVSIIMDGNGRWAKQHGKERLFGHNEGAESVRACCEAAAASGVKYLTLFAFSTENWNRPQSEVDGLMQLMVRCMSAELENFKKNGIKFRVIGEIAGLPQYLQDEIASVESQTAELTGLNLILMMNYSGKWDILQATRRYAEDLKNGVVDVPLTPEVFSGYLSTAGIPDPDLLIRTSGEQRISNYMLWQCAYTEFYYTDVLWPDFRKEDFGRALESFKSRDRRYGKVK